MSRDVTGRIAFRAKVTGQWQCNASFIKCTSAIRGKHKVVNNDQEMDAKSWTAAAVAVAAAAVAAAATNLSAAK